jgi:GDP-4-dehydro-6-deoxy-D-mannose reductase
VRGLWLAAECCAAGEVYNVSGRQIYSVQDVIETIRPFVKAAFRVEQDPALIRACDEPVIAGDTTKFHSCTGWTTEIELIRTVGDMLDWWRNRLASELTAHQAESLHTEIV